MNRDLNITIDKPCTEKFDSFQVTKVGGFCNSCQKEVIDFTELSEQEIVAYFRNRKEKTCGRFRSAQLKTYSEVITSKRKLSYNFLTTSFFGFSLLSLLSIHQGKAQQHTTVEVVHTPQKINNQPQNPNAIIKGEHYVEGVVVDENAEPLPGISVYIKGTTTGTVTNAEGKFKISEPVKTGDVIVFAGIGYETKQFVVKENAPKIITLRMEFRECDMVLMGEVATQEIYTSKRTFWQKLKDLFR